MVGKTRYADVAVPALWAHLALGLTVGMIVLGVAWEAALQPLRDGSLLWLKVLPLVAVVPGLYRRRVRSFQIMSLLIWLYICEALVRVLTPSVTELVLSIIWALLGTAVFVVVSLGSRASRRMAAKVAAGDSPSDSARRQ